MIETPPVNEVQLHTIVIPANLKRFLLEADSTKKDELWDQSGLELVLPILDAGAVQFRDGSFRLGQVSRALTNPHANVDSKQSEAELRASIKKILPKFSRPKTFVSQRKNEGLGRCFWHRVERSLTLAGELIYNPIAQNADDTGILADCIQSARMPQW
ncbi:MAG: hypothetical protein KME30_09470 [Iphinoe sp. HA4291-MV1]|jgi:hypothetical protein|nr:hypothetical protein [Iphinoe sp. HA4291-MV1]